MRPADAPVGLSDVSKRTLECIQRYSRLAWPILKTQCKLLGLDPATLTESDVPKLAVAIGAATARFTSPVKGKQLERELLGGHRPLREENDEPRTWSKRLFSPTASLNGISARVLEVLETHTPLGWTILEAQCQRTGVDPRNLDRHSLARVIPVLEQAVGRFSSADKARAIARELTGLL